MIASSFLRPNNLKARDCPQRVLSVNRVGGKRANEPPDGKQSPLLMDIRYIKRFANMLLETKATREENLATNNEYFIPSMSFRTKYINIYLNYVHFLSFSTSFPTPHKRGPVYHHTWGPALSKLSPILSVT